MGRERYWMAGAAVMAALAAVPLTQAGQASAQQTKPQVQATSQQALSLPQALNRDGQPVRVVYGAPVTAR